MLTLLFSLRPGDEQRLTPNELKRYRAEALVWTAQRRGGDGASADG